MLLQDGFDEIHAFFVVLDDSVEALVDFVEVLVAKLAKVVQDKFKQNILD